MRRVNDILAGISLEVWGDSYAQQPVLQQYPLMMLLMMHGSIHLKLTEAEQRELTRLRSVEDLLLAIGLQADEHTLAIIDNCDADQKPEFWMEIPSLEILHLYEAFSTGIWKAIPINLIPTSIKHLVELSCLLVKYPALTQARFLKTSTSQIRNYQQIQFLIDRALPLAEQPAVNNFDKETRALPPH